MRRFLPLTPTLLLLVFAQPVSAAKVRCDSTPARHSVAPGELWHLPPMSDVELCTPGGRRLRWVRVREYGRVWSWCGYLPPNDKRTPHGYLQRRTTLPYSACVEADNGDLINSGTATVVVRYWQG